MAIDHYDILGLEHGATHAEIKKAHRKLALRSLSLPRLPARPLTEQHASWVSVSTLARQHLGWSLRS